MTDTTDLQPCPFCETGELGLTSRSYDRGPVFGLLWQIQCCACQAAGPIACTWEEAAAAWNSRPEGMKK